jgi:hypothetical protein
MESSAGMFRARAVAVGILLVSYGALGARQPAVRTSVPLPVSAAQLATSLGLDPDDKSQLVVSIVRLVFDAPDGTSADDHKRRAMLTAQFSQPSTDVRDRVPLPLDTSIWRETLLTRQVRESEIVPAILSERATALLYHGLAALDDDTLGWLGPDRETLLHLRRNSGVFAAFGRSIKVRGGRVSVPGGTDAEPIWSALVGADVARPSAFVQRLIRGNGRLAWFYDTVAHLDANRQQVVLGSRGSEASRVERVRELLDVFEAAAPEWHTPDRPFVRPTLDPSLVISVATATDRGDFRGPVSRKIWDAVFREDTTEGSQSPSDSAALDTSAIEPGWLARRISLVPSPIGRRRFETFLFAQRVFADVPREDSTLLGALRGASTYPALALTLERIGSTSPTVYAAAARVAALLNNVRTAERRRTAIAEFQSALAIIDRAARVGGIDRRRAADLTASLIALPISADAGYGASFSEWVRQELLQAFPLQADATDPIEEAILAACAGVKDATAQPAVIEWEGRRYRVDPATAELRRLHRVRDRQRAVVRGTARSHSSLDARLAALDAATDADRPALDQAVAETLTSIVYALHLGEPEGAAASAGDAAMRHDFRLDDGVGAPKHTAWRLPREEHVDRSGWRVAGSLLGLDVALSRLALRRLDLSDMPGEPTMSTNVREAATVTAALFGPIADSSPTPAEIAASIERGRARITGIQNNQSDIDRVARDAGLSEWRREALAWTVEHEREKALARFSLVELFWLGSPRAKARHFDAWGAATTALDGCLCLSMPEAEPWESRAGRSSTGHLATRGADVALRVAEFLAEFDLPAVLAPGIVSYAMQDLLDTAQPAFFDDWPTFERTARALPRERLIDFVAALAAGGALVPATPADSRH